MFVSRFDVLSEIHKQNIHYHRRQVLQVILQITDILIQSQLAHVNLHRNISTVRMAMRHHRLYAYFHNNSFNTDLCFVSILV